MPYLCPNKVKPDITKFRGERKLFVLEYTCIMFPFTFVRTFLGVHISALTSAKVLIFTE